MAGVIRLANTGGGQSTISGSATSSQTFILPAQGGTLSVGGGGGGGIADGDSATLDDLTVSGDLRVSGTTFMSGNITASGQLVLADGFTCGNGNNFITNGSARFRSNANSAVQVLVIQNDEEVSNVVLNADGSAEFASGNFTIANGGGLITEGNVLSSGFFRSERAGGGSAAYQARFNGNLGAEMLATGTLRIGGDIPASPQIELNADGSASFSSGKVAIADDGQLEASGTLGYALIGRSNSGPGANVGTIFGQNDNNTGHVFVGCKVGGIRTSFITSEGAATFASGEAEISAAGSGTFAGGLNISGVLTFDMSQLPAI